MKYLLLIFSLLYAVPCSAQDVFEKKEFVVEITGIIDQTTTDEILASPWKVVSDSKGHIFLWDRKFTSIRVFNRQGEFIKQIGKSGRGPGEFREINAMTINDKDQLVVYDRYLLRFTVFDNLGNEIETYSLPEKNLITPWRLQHSPAAGYFMVYKRFDQLERDEVNKPALHRITNNFSEISNSLVTLAQIGDPEEPFEQLLFGAYPTLNFTLLRNNEIIVAPYVYRGNLLVYEQKNGEWRRKEELVGTPLPSEPYKTFSLNKSRNEIPPGARLINGANDRRAGIIFHESVALFEMKDSKVIHFVFFRDDENGSYLAAEIYNKDLKLIQFGRLKNFEGSRDASYSITWLDNDENFYVIDRSDQQNPRILLCRLKEL